jgi:hypothetical protein
VPSPLRPHTTMAIEKENVAARAAQPTVISMVMAIQTGTVYARRPCRLGILDALSSDAAAPHPCA